MKIMTKLPNKLFHGFINLLLILFSVTCLFPILWVINSSLRTNGEFMMNVLRLPTKLHWENYYTAIFSRNLGRNFFNSFYLTVLSVMLVLVAAFIVGYFLSRYDFPGRKYIYGLFVSGLIVPMIALMIPVFMMFNKAGMLDRWYTLLFPYVAFNMPISIILIENFIHTIPRELDESAKIDGASQFQLMMHVIFPLTKPILLTLVILNMMGVWNEFPFALVLLRNPNLATISVGVNSFKSMHSLDYPLYMAALSVATLPIIIVFAICSKRIMQGMTVGAVKG